MWVYLRPGATSDLWKLGCEKCGYLADVGKARTSIRWVAPSLASSPRNCSSDRVECPIVKRLAGSTLHEAAPLYPWTSRGRSKSCRSSLMQCLAAEKNSGRSNVVS